MIAVKRQAVSERRQISKRRLKILLRPKRRNDDIQSAVEQIVAPHCLPIDATGYAAERRTVATGLS